MICKATKQKAQVCRYGKSLNCIMDQKWVS